MIRTMEAACKLFGPEDGEDVSGLAKSFYDQLCRDIPDLIHILHEKRPSKHCTLRRITINRVIRANPRWPRAFEGT